MVAGAERRAVRVVHAEVSLATIRDRHDGTVPGKATLFWFDATSGELLLWGMGDEASGLRMVPR